MRLFVGMPAPPTPAYAELTAALRAAHPDLRPVPEGSWHATLRFLGEVADPDPVVASLDAALQGRRAQRCQVQGLGAFPRPERARVAWIGLEAPGIKQVVEAVNGATALYGEPPDPRPYHAHVTLGRFKVGADLSMDVHRDKDTFFVEGSLDEVVLWASTLTREGPRYERVATWPLQGGPAGLTP